MSIVDWFRPKWKHFDPDVRMEAVTALTKQRVLADIAKNDKISSVRKAAVDRVTDQSLLADIVKNADYVSYAEVRTAVDRVTDQSLLADIAKNANCEMLSEAAVDRVTDQSLLADIAKNANGEVRVAAVNRLIDHAVLDDQSLLADIAKKAKTTFRGGYGGYRIVEHVTDQTLLLDIVKNANDLQVRKAAVKRVIDQSLPEVQIVLNEIAQEQHEWEVYQAIIPD